MRDSRPCAFPPLSFTLRGFYFLAFFGLGVYGPYLSIFLHSRGLSGAEVGTVWALMPLGAVLAPPLWGMVADKFRNRKALIFCLSAAGGGLFSGLLVAETFLALAAVVFTFSAFRTSTLPLVESATLEYLDRKKNERPKPDPEGAVGEGNRPAAYGGYRLWGSVGFITASLFIGYLVDTFSIRAMVYVFLAAAGIQALLALTLPSEGKRGGTRARLGPEIAALLKQPQFVAFLAAGFFLRTSHGALWTFLPIHMKTLGLPGWVIGWSFSVGVAAEVVLLMFSGPLLERWGARTFLLISAGAAAIRWSLYPFARGPWAFLSISLLHAFTFAAFHVASVGFVYKNTPPSLKSSGQALFSASTYGAGGIAGAVLAGTLFRPLGIDGLFFASAAVALVSFTIYWTALPRRG